MRLIHLCLTTSLILILQVTSYAQTSVNQTIPNDHAIKFQPGATPDPTGLITSIWRNTNGRLRIDHTAGLEFRALANNSLFITNSGGTTKFLFHPAGNSYLNGGNVGIGMGANVALNYKLEVKGTIRAMEVLVESTPWPDYVFFDKYDLMTLEETATYIQQNGHLPEVPSAAEVAENGIKVGEMNALLLKKIEELTLHLIEKDKEISELKKDKTLMLDLIKRVENLEILGK